MSVTAAAAAVSVAAAAGVPVPGVPVPGVPVPGVPVPRMGVNANVPAGSAVCVSGSPGVSVVITVRVLAWPGRRVGVSVGVRAPCASGKAWTRTGDQKKYPPSRMRNRYANKYTLRCFMRPPCLTYLKIYRESECFPPLSLGRNVDLPAIKITEKPKKINGCAWIDLHTFRKGSSQALQKFWIRSLHQQEGIPSKHIDKRRL